MQATAYGFNCISVSKGTFDNTDPMTLNAVLGHEIHIPCIWMQNSAEPFLPRSFLRVELSV